MADLIAVMNAGELQQVGSPEEIYERPANRFVATFVGNPPMNVLKARLTDGGLCAGWRQCRAETGKARGPGRGRRPDRDGRAARGFQLSPTPRSPGALKGGEIYVVEPMGNETLVEVRVGDVHLSVRAGRGFTARVASKVGVKFDADDACFFDAVRASPSFTALITGGVEQ